MPGGLESNASGEAPPTLEPTRPSGSATPRSASSADTPVADTVPMAAAPSGGFNRYLVGTELGRGGMGTVLRVWDYDLDRAVAMKVLNEVIADDEGCVARFVQEARLAARLQHPAIVPIYDVGKNAEGRLYFTMRLVEGKTLGEIIRLAREGDADVSRAYTRFRLLETFREICLAMSYVHEHGIVHRDLKPDNVMLGAYGEVLVMDWGSPRRSPPRRPRLRPSPARPPRSSRRATAPRPWPAPSSGRLRSWRPSRRGARRG